MKIHPKIFTRWLMVSTIFGFLLADLLVLDLYLIWPVLVSLALGLVIIMLVIKEVLLRLIAFSVLFFVLSVILGSYINTQYIPPKDLVGRNEIVGVVSERPVQNEKQRLVLEVKDKGGKYKVLVNLPRYPEYSYGEELRVFGKIEEPQVFDDFNYKNYLKGRQIYLVVNRVEKVEELGQGGSTAKSWLYLVASKFETALNKSLPEPEASFAAGLVIGSRRNLPDSLIENMQTTGTSHLVAISGYNITIIIGALIILFMPLGRRLSFASVILFILAFVVLSGASASVVRGALVGSLALFSRVIDRRPDQTNLLLLAAILILIFNPLMVLYDLGFLLSFAAFSGLIYAAPAIGRLFESKKLLAKIPKFFSGPLTETLAAQAIALPILLFSFGKFSLIAPLTNVLILPLIPLAMLLSFITGIFGIIADSLGVVFGYIAWPLLKYPLGVIDFFSKIPVASFDLKKGSFVLLFGLYFVIIILSIFLRRRLTGVNGN